MNELLKRHYEKYPYPVYPLLASVRRHDCYAHNIDALWSFFNGRLPEADSRRILLAGCGSFSPYPAALANPDDQLLALDLSLSSIRRARLHCLLHGCRNVSFSCGDILDPDQAKGRFGFIDAYGVVHHLAEPSAGLRALSERLSDGGIMRIMVYHRYARTEEESIRLAFRLMGINDLASAKRILNRAVPGSRLHAHISASYDARSDAGIADAFLNPRVRTYTADTFCRLIEDSGLRIMKVAGSGPGALSLDEIRGLESVRKSPGNLVAYVARNSCQPVRNDRMILLRLNPCLERAVSFWRFLTVRPVSRFGEEPPPIDGKAKKFLSRFRNPVSFESLSEKDKELSDIYIRALFLLKYST